MEAISVADLGNDLSFGARVEGITWETLADEVVRDRLRALFVERGFIVFKDVEPTSKMQVAISEVFGPLKDHPTKSTLRDAEIGDEAQGVIDMHHVPSEDAKMIGGLVEIDGRVVARFSPWHFDHCYNDELNYAGVLRAPINAPEGGRTGFLDGIDLYRRFPKALRERIEGLNVIYTLDTRLSKMRFGVNFKTQVEAPETVEALLKEAAIFPRAMHPAVWTRDDGRKVLHIGPWMAVGVEHHEDAEGEALFEEVCQEINRIGKTTSYWHDWSPTDMVIWDNTRMVHAVEGCDPKYERRTLRTTIKGDYGLGYFEEGKKIGEVHRELA